MLHFLLIIQTAKDRNIGKYLILEQSKSKPKKLLFVQGGLVRGTVLHDPNLLGPWKVAIYSCTILKRYSNFLQTY